MSPINSELEFMEIYWINRNGVELKACYPKDKGEIMLSKHLIPKQNEGIISNVRKQII